MCETILLHAVEGIARLSGTDQHGCHWCQWTIDWGALEEPGECALCGKTMTAGWVCGDGGDEVCAEHVVTVDELADDFVAAYLEAALWSSTDEDGQPLDASFGTDDIAPDSLAKLRADCLDFLAAHGADVLTDLARAGQDFWLTRNGHGSGFWDGDWADDVGKRLTDAAHAYGSCNLYVGDDGLVHAS